MSQQPPNPDQVIREMSGPGWEKVEPIGTPYGFYNAFQLSRVTKRQVRKLKRRMRKSAILARLKLAMRALRGEPMVVAHPGSRIEGATVYGGIDVTSDIKPGEEYTIHISGNFPELSPVVNIRNNTFRN